MLGYWYSVDDESASVDAIKGRWRVGRESNSYQYRVVFYRCNGKDLPILI